MSSSLKAIQVFAKVGQIVSKVVFICCLIGAIGCLVGITALLCLPETLVIDGVGVVNMIERESGFLTEQLVVLCIIGCLACIAECVIAGYAARYFADELQAGTPFTLSGAQQMCRLGVLILAVSLALSVAQGIILALCNNWVSQAEAVTVEDIGSFGVGIVFLVLSVVFRHGAELREQGGGER